MKQLLLCLLSTCALTITVRSHVLDQYLQVAQIALATEGVQIELRLIPGVQVAERVSRLIDTDSDGQITTTEEQAYAQRVLQDIQLSLNDVRLPLTLTATQFPTPQEMREGLGTIRLTLAAATTLREAGQQQLVLRNNHVPELGVYLVNALVPTWKEIRLSGQERDPLQREMRLSFHVTAADTTKQPSWLGALIFCVCVMLLIPQWKHLRQYWRRCNDEKIYAKKTSI
ncbi:MAG: hypothetical protein JNM09_17285 [Blastocatellia bacterium]|nr:hypothetical protein [Blastocatellia bacterium]